MKHRPEQILDAAIALFDEDGVRVSTRKIAAAAGVANGTLFNYFGSKQELLDALYVRVKLDLAAAIGDIDPELDIKTQAHLLWQRWLGWAFDDPARNRVAALLHQSGLASQVAVDTASAAFAVPRRILDDAAALGVLIDLPPDYLAALVQQQLELAVQANLDPTHHDTAFEAMWKSITRAHDVQGATS